MLDDGFGDLFGELDEHVVERPAGASVRFGKHGKALAPEKGSAKHERQDTGETSMGAPKKGPRGIGAGNSSFEPTAQASRAQHADALTRAKIPRSRNTQGCGNGLREMQVS